MKVRQYMVGHVTTVSPDDNVTSVARLMAEREVTSVVVVSGGRPSGIVAEHDFISRLLAKEKDPRTTKVSEIMSSPLVDISPEASIFDAVALMRKRNFSQLPVMEGDKLVGIVTLDSLLGVLASFFGAHRF